MAEQVLITGASSGIGEALAHRFAEHGHPLVLVAEPDQPADAVAAAISARHGVPTLALAVDLTEAGAAELIAAELRQRKIEIGILVNDAAVGHRQPFHEAPLEKAIEIIRLNVEAPVRLTNQFLPAMVARGAGRILMLGSVAGFQPGPLLAVYHASKAFVVSFGEAIRDELKGSGVSVTVLCPGPTDTDFFARADMEDARIVQDGIVMDPDEVARIGYDALMAGDDIIIPGLSNKVMTFTRRLIPKSLQATVNHKFYEVKAE